MHLPEPALTLTLPSIHDGTILDCRIYHPLGLASSLSFSTSSTGQPKNAAIVAHPYAPLGGSYDDPVLDEVAGQLLAKDFIVGTFNFRGAGQSAGRTSWTARPERDDYTSFVGFMVYYVHYLDPDSPPPPDAQPPILILGGYSYGAMVTAQLPPLPALLAPFTCPTSTSEAGHIRILAETLGSRQRELLSTTRLGMRGRRSMRVGEGGGSLSSSPRKSHDSKRSRSFSLDEAEEILKRGAQEIMAKTRHSLHHSPRASVSQATPVPTALPPIENLVKPRPAYILISPLQGIITNLATMSRSPSDMAAEAKLRQNPTLAVYGNQDIFVAVSKLRSWKIRMEAADGDPSGDAAPPGSSGFQGREVDGAGHFWIEEGVLGQMIGWVGEFVRDLTRDARSDQA